MWSSSLTRAARPGSGAATASRPAPLLLLLPLFDFADETAEVVHRIAVVDPLAHRLAPGIDGPQQLPEQPQDDPVVVGRPARGPAVGPVGPGLGRLGLGVVARLPLRL